MCTVYLHFPRARYTRHYCSNSHNNGVHREVNVDKRLCTPACISSTSSVQVFQSIVDLPRRVCHAGYARVALHGTGLYSWIMNIVSNFLRKLTAGPDLPQSPLLASCNKI